MTMDVSCCLQGKVALVTGAAGDIGRRTVELLSAQGAVVVAEDRKPDVAELAVEGRIITLVGDLADEATAARATALAMERFGQLDILVNNAGRHLSRSALETTAADWDAVLNVNARGTFFHSREALRVMAPRGEGAIVNVASISGVVGIADQVCYAASKGAIVQMTKALAVEFGRRGIRINAVAPGVVMTGFLDDQIPDGRARLARRADSHALGRIGTPEEIAGVIAFLASPAASFMTGAIVMADGGYTAM
ncbi:SDR family oxidoreductase [Aquabacter sp. CN5-332]|uniref:SDR family NAD(P)-dependent oxidoreductase n=1 Tax=Aquabacter sp. CN5-332 TaxID=3156608 RepID=UPI0032B47602